MIGFKLLAVAIVAIALIQYGAAQSGSGTAPTGTAPTGAAPTGTAPTGAAPTGTAPTGTAPSGAAPTGAAPTGTAPTGAAPTGTAPTGAAPTGTAPTGAAPTGTAPTGAAPSGTAPTGAAPSGTAPTGAAPTGTAATGAAPSGTAPTGAAPSGTAPTGAAPTGSAPTGAAPSGTAPTGAAPTGTAPTGAAPTGTAPTGAAPTGTAPTGAAPTGTAPTAVAASGAVPTTALAALSSPMRPTIDVITKSGPVKGEKLTSLFESRTYFSYKGIPYAQPPIGELRYLPPVPIVPWTEPKIANKFGNICLQYDKSGAMVGDEDCLTLNVYAPEMSVGQPALPVLVYIHGGDWVEGSGSDELYGPDFIVNKLAILVTFNYRLGAMGFLNLNLINYPGNQGLKDQQLVLKWVNENIASFNGDPTKVTIFGHGSGSTCCELHRFSTSSQAYFFQTIEMSAAWDYWTMFSSENALMEYTLLASKKRMDAITYLKQTDGRIIMSSYPKQNYYTFPLSIVTKWGPVIEEIDSIQPFITVKPIEQLLSNYTSKINVFTGFASAEGLYFAKEVPLDPASYTPGLVLSVDLPNTKFIRDYTSARYKEAAKEIVQKYYPNGITPTQSTIDSSFQLLMHIFQNYPMDRRIKANVQQTDGNTFLYRFRLETQFNYYKNAIGGTVKQVGAAHGDELCYIFNCKIAPEMYANVTLGSPEYGVLSIMPTLVTNFARFSAPIPYLYPNFQPCSSPNMKFLDIKNSGVVFREKSPFNDEMEFWRLLMLKYSDLFEADEVESVMEFILSYWAKPITEKKVQ